MRLCFLLELVPLRSEKIKSHAHKNRILVPLTALRGSFQNSDEQSRPFDIGVPPPLVSLTSMLYPFLEISTHTKKVLLKPETKILSLCYSGCFFFISWRSRYQGCDRDERKKKHLSLRHLTKLF